MYIFILIELIISLLICITCFLIHFRQHFRLQCCSKHYQPPQLIQKLSNKLSNNPNSPDTNHPNPAEYPKLQPRNSLFSKDTWDHPEVNYTKKKSTEITKYHFYIHFALFFLCLHVKNRTQFNGVCVQRMTRNLISFLLHSYIIKHLWLFYP